MRAILSLVWELASRVITTTLLFGVFESVRLFPDYLTRDRKDLCIKIMMQISQIVATTTLDGLWNFLTSTTLKQIMIMR